MINYKQLGEVDLIVFIKITLDFKSFFDFALFFIKINNILIFKIIQKEENYFD